METLQKIIKNRKTNTVDALSVYDSLPSVSLDFMIGRWKGYEIKTGHQLDGLLELLGWYGKLFINQEEAHPLIFFGSSNTLFAINPKHIPLRIKLPKSKVLSIIMRFFRPFLQTKKSKARLRMVEHRGKITATMIYDDKAIYDHFHKIDEDTVLGCMDLKGMSQPYFWIMERDNKTSYKFNA